MILRTTAVILALVTAAQGQEWPGWRGPKRDGTTPETKFPLRWSATENVLWKVEVPGKGHSSPVVWGDRVLLATSIEDKGERRLLCLDRKDGHVLWDRLVLTVSTGNEHVHPLNSLASSTPVTDGKHIWIAYLDNPRFAVFCYDMEGTLAWKVAPGEFHSVHGFCSSPLLYKDTVIFNGDQDAVAWIVALDQATGKERWRADRPNRTRSYAPPVIFEAGGKTQMVLSGSKCVASYDPDTGKQIWIIDGPTEQFVASMICAEDVFFITGGFPQFHVLGIKFAPYRIMFQLSRTHVLSAEPGPLTPEQVYCALRAGHAYFSIELQTEARGFVWLAHARHQVVGIMGDEIEFRPGLTLYAHAPGPANMTYYKDGEAMETVTGQSWEIPVTGPGVYRLEASRFDKPWIFSNPIYVRPAKEQPVEETTAPPPPIP